MPEIGKYDGIAAEKEMLKFWEENNTYQKAKDKSGKGKNFYFLDGPPYTSGGIHIGTAWNKILKDFVLRYKRIKGFNVYDRAGYDMHGLPTALKVMEKLGIKHKDDIAKFGIAKFIEECKTFSLNNMDKMTKEFQRLGVWMDFENAYLPITQEFIEGEWWLIKKAHENNRLYEGEKVMHWCQHCATSLAKHELEYKNVKDDSIFVKLKVKGKDEYLIIWTTTPWTIPYNLGIMAHPDLDYIRARVKDDEKEEIWILAKGLAGGCISSVADKEFEIIEEFKGEKLKGIEYEHPFSDQIKKYSELKAKHPNVHTVVLTKEYVDLGSGTGLVHSAPGCGPEDYEVGRQNNVPPFNNLDENGVFPDEMGEFSGLIAKKDDKRFLDALDKRNALIATTEVEHEYPYCWRCKKPVIFRTTTQWFFKVEDIKEEMKELNKKIYWMPDWAGNKQFHAWLDNLRDNGITRQRYWGTPLPIWRCNKCRDYIVVGSVKELESLGADKPTDLHIPWIDEITFKCRKCPGTMKRLPDILDVWVDAGTTSWTCLDYPHKKELFDMMYPPDFILEGKDQIRGWFNLLFVASMVSMKSIAFKACYMHGFVNDAMGRKMSKSLGNVISPDEVIEKYGADVFRYYSIGGANPGLDLNYNFDDMKVKHRNLSVLWNLHKFVIEYSSELNINPKELEISDGELSIEDVYMLSKLNSAIKKATKMFDEYRLNEVPLAVEELFLELSRTYIQLVRKKSSTGSEEEKRVVLYTLYRVLYESLRLFCPVVPMLTDKIYHNMKSAFNLDFESIHLTGWPEADEERIDKELEHAFVHTKAVIQVILHAREKISLGVRWPIKEAIVVTKNEKAKISVMELKDIIKTLTNVKDLDVVDRFNKVREKLKADFSKLEADFKHLTPKIIAHIMNESPEAVLQHIEKDGKHSFSIDDRGESKEISIVKEHIIIERIVDQPYKETEFEAGSVYINTELTKELLAEGYSRELMRRVQSLRKKQGLKKSDTIELFVRADKELNQLFKYHEQDIKEKVGAKTLTFTELEIIKSFDAKSKEKVKDKELEILFNKIGGA